MIKEITVEAEEGRIYTGKVVRIEDYGAFVEILPNTDGLLHISEISPQRIRNVRDVLKLGQTIRVKVISIDENNKIRLSKKALEQDSQSNDYQNRPQKKGPYKNRNDRDRF